MISRPSYRGRGRRGANSGRGLYRARGRPQRDVQHRTRRDYSQTHRDSNSDNGTLDQVVNKFSSMLDTITRRLDTLEGKSNVRDTVHSNDHQQHRPARYRNDDRDDYPQRRLGNSKQQTRDHQAQRRPATYTARDSKRWSENADFRELVRCNMKYVQLQHHYRNWNDCPKGVSKAIDNVINNIKPPQASEDLRGYLKECADDFKSAITGVLQAHLHLESNKLEQKIATLDQSDNELMQSIVTKQLKRRLGNRITDDTITSAFDRYQSRHNPTTTHNNVNHVDTESEQEDTQDEVSDMESETVGDKPQERTKRPHTESPAVESPSDRATKIHVSSVSPPYVQREHQTSQEHARSNVRGRSGIRASSKVVHKTGREAKNWSFSDLHPSTTTLIVADSNGKAFADTELPDDYQVYSFSGMKLSQAANLITRSTDHLRHVRHIIVAVGINDRSCNNDSEIISSLNNVKDWGIHNQKRVVFTGIPTAPQLQEKEARIVSHINELADDIFEDDFLQSVHTSQFAVQFDKTGIHYTSSTAAKILRIIIRFLN